jgi:hypothetical protein
MSLDEWGWGEGEQEAAPQPFQILPAGRHAAQITSCVYESRTPKHDKWRDTNPEGKQLSLTLEAMVGGRRFVFWDDVPRHFRWKVEQVCEAAGVQLTAGPEQIAASLVGRRVEVETSIITLRSGQEKVKVERFYPAEADAPPPAPPETPKSRPARTPHQKAKAATAAAGLPLDDDIPF